MDKRKITIIKGKDRHQIIVSNGRNLRRALLDAGFSPYTPLTARLNCGGRGICATCGVWIHEPNVRPTHWHDKLAKIYGYPRLSCQIQVESDMTIEMVTEKKIWGSRRK